jgi:two-component system, LytTR family, response regulator
MLSRSHGTDDWLLPRSRNTQRGSEYRFRSCIRARIFTVIDAWPSHSNSAFEAGALDYLLKPFDNGRFERALDRAKERIAQGRRSTRTVEHIAVKSAGELTFLKISEIDWIEAADYYSCLHVGAKSHLLRRSMAELDEELDQSVFCRIHRSIIVKLDRVRGLKLNENGEYDVLLRNGTRLRLSRRYRKQLQSRLDLPGTS